MGESERGDIVEITVKLTAEAAIIVGVAGKTVAERAGKTAEIFVGQQIQKAMYRKQRK